MRELDNTIYGLTPGTKLHLDGNAIRVTHPDVTGRKLIPMSRVDHVVLLPGTGVTDDLIRRLGTDGKTVTWLTGNGRHQARTTGPTHPNAHLRLAQYRAHDNPAHTLEIGRNIVGAKLQNTRQLILRAARDQAATPQQRLRGTADALGAHIQALPLVTSANELLGYEGIAAKEYVACWPLLMTPASAVPAPTHRGTRPAADPFNSALNFVYSLLRVATSGALETVGLDPYVGYLHSVRPSKPALALDLMEEFRALLVDRFIITAFNRRQLTDKHFHNITTSVVELTDAGRKTIFELWSESRRKEWPHPVLKQPVPAALLPITQATLLARHLRGDLAHYQPWTPF